MSYANVEKFISQYFDVLYTQDLDLYDRVFDKSCILYSQNNDETIVRPFDEYRTILANRASPQSLKHSRDEKILMIDRLSDKMVLVKVRLRLFDGIMEDHLCLMETKDGWRIFSKFFTRVGDAA